MLMVFYHDSDSALIMLMVFYHNSAMILHLMAILIFIITHGFLWISFVSFGFEFYYLVAISMSTFLNVITYKLVKEVSLAIFFCCLFVFLCFFFEDPLSFFLKLSFRLKRPFILGSNLRNLLSSPGRIADSKYWPYLICSFSNNEFHYCDAA